jgi:hypothetical protein
MTITNIEGKVILLVGKQLLADEVSAMLTIEGPDKGPLGWSINNIVSHADYGEVVSMLKEEQLMHLNFTPTRSEQSYMGAAIARRVSALNEGCSIDVIGTGALHGFNPNDLR